ncbi:MAG: peptidylprolyl isomerase [Terracidiphilus sp.]|jgi:peptidyl-prolyl cis-trans isomerase SurA
MRTRHSIRIAAAGALLCACCCAAAGSAQEQQTQQTAVVLDRVVAVVNRRVILSSDLDDEIQFSVLDPNRVGQGTLTRQRALEQLIGRALIEQQIRQEDAQAAEPPAAEVAARLNEIRKELPACVRANCASDQGWKAFLAEHGLTPERVETYARRRLEVLRFIEQRFRQGIQISEQQIAAYYNDTLLPQYAPGESAPPLDQVAPRIEEILLEQQVNALFDDWLANLRKQGDVEILDPALETAESDGAQGKASQ